MSGTTLVIETQNTNHYLLVAPLLRALAAQLEDCAFRGRFEVTIEQGRLFVAANDDGVEVRSLTNSVFNQQINEVTL